MPFRSFGLDAGILQAVQKAGYTTPTPIQIAAIPRIMQGQDIIGIAQTGTGKTAAFVLPMLHRLSLTRGGRQGIKALILAPTRELALQIKENIEAYGKHLSVKVAAIYGGVDEEAQIKILRQGVQIVVATPGRLLDLMEQQKSNLGFLEILVLDEADRMLHMGFLPDIETIISTLPKRRQTLMFSATLSKEIESLARRFQYQAKMVQIGKRSNPADTVTQYIYEVPYHLKNALLLVLLRQPEFKKVLVFAKLKDGADRITNFLKDSAVKVAKLHSSRSQEQRLQALKDFKDGTAQVLVATDIVARGIDVEGITHVVNYDFPVNPEDYVHRIGRTGRAHAEGEAISFVPEEDLNLLDRLEHFISRRLERKRVKGFNYNAPIPPFKPGETPVRRDWRKRTREMEAKKKGKPFGGLSKEQMRNEARKKRGEK